MKTNAAMRQKSFKFKSVMIKTIQKHGVRRVSNEIIGPFQMNLFNIGQYG